jgi:hypothetical protein
MKSNLVTLTVCLTALAFAGPGHQPATQVNHQTSHQIAPDAEPLADLPDPQATQLGSSIDLYQEHGTAPQSDLTPVPSELAIGLMNAEAPPPTRPSPPKNLRIANAN